MPAIQKLNAAFLLHLEGEHLIDGPVVLHVFQAVPIAHGQTGQVGRAQAGVSRHNVAAGGIRHLLGILLALGGVGHHAQLIPQLLNSRASHKDAALQGVLHVILVAHADGGHQAVFTLHNLAAGVHQQEAAGAVGVLHLAGLKAALAEQGALMVPCRTGNGDKSA